VQRAGELVFVPEGWHHATLNYGDTLAVAQQSRVGATSWLRLRLLAKQLSNAGRFTEATAVLKETIR
jgi:hypothetical protein